MVSDARSKWWFAAALLGTACTSDPQLVASNCDPSKPCVKTEALKIDAVDILLVLDDSSSFSAEAKQLQAQLPRMLTAITTGEAEDMSFPPAQSVHVAVTTTDMGGAAGHYYTCIGAGQDGEFVEADDRGVTCAFSPPGYVVYPADAATASAADAASCVPMVFADLESGRVNGCGFEQPLEAALKALWPAEDTSLKFHSGTGHGTGKNAGFLRDNSVLVVIILSDEDDCSAADREFLALDQKNGPYSNQPVNLRCYLNRDKLHAPERYIEHLKRLRPNNDHVIFAVVGGIPAELTSEERRSHYDFTVAEEADRYFTDVLAASEMQEATVDELTMVGHLRPSCAAGTIGAEHSATPPRRLVEVARGFGAQGVLGSICAQDFGDPTGQIIRKVAEKLTATAEH